MQGTVCNLNLERGFGFIAVDGDRDRRGRHFFHATRLAPGVVFDEKLQGRRVEFESEMGEKGLVANNVRPI